VRDIIATLIGAVLFPALAFYALVPLLVTAWRSGIMPARGVDYPRAERPGMFWFLTGFCVFNILMSLFAAYVLLWRFL
jgi:hypothetical protein